MNMSFSMTTEQILNESKTVTRRLGWWKLKPGDILHAIEKGQGLKKGEKVRHLKTIRVVSVRKEPLRDMIDDTGYGLDETAKEGFIGIMTGDGPAFVMGFCAANKCTPDTIVNRIEFEYMSENTKIEWCECPFCGCQIESFLKTLSAEQLKELGLSRQTDLLHVRERPQEKEKGLLL